MRRFAPLAAALLLLGCEPGGDSSAGDTEPAPINNVTAAPAAPPSSPAPQPTAAAAHWDLRTTGEGSVLALLSASGSATIRLLCPAGGKTLLVNVPAFRAVDSEERMSVGSGGAVTALVADTRGDGQRGGVSGGGTVPADLAELIAGPVSASYGAQISGPHPAPPPALAHAFAAACRPSPKAQTFTANPPCQMQGGKRLSVQPLRVTGTEPFWAAATEGRCVTYSHPDDQKGSRIWTRYTAGAAGGGVWFGAYEGKPFELRISSAPGCSDGMSDRRYPFAAALLIKGERRRGCAAPS